MSDFVEQLKSFEGVEVGTVPGADEVNQAMIRHWVEAIGDENPVYVDRDAAAASVHGEIVAPPTMLQAWVMRGLRLAGAARGGGGAQDELMDLLDGAGFSSVVATNCEQEYHREVKLGDHLSATTTIEAVSDEKTTALGIGHFVTTRVEYRDDAGEPVGTMQFRILKFKPQATAAPPTVASGARAREGDREGEGGRGAAEPEPEEEARAPRPRPAITHDNAFWFEGTKAHKLLIQRCTKCGALRHPPRPVCAECRSYDWDTVEASGRGTIYSYVVNHYPQVPAFDYPLVVGLVELEEGTRLVANLMGIQPEAVEIGAAVEVEWHNHDPDLTLPAFKRVGT